MRQARREDGDRLRPQRRDDLQAPGRVRALAGARPGRRAPLRSLRQGTALQGVGAGALRPRERMAEARGHCGQTPRWLNQPPASSSR